MTYLPWQPIKTAPEDEKLLILLEDQKMQVGFKTPTKDGFLGRWYMVLPDGKNSAIGWPIAWTNLPDKPSDDHFEKLKEATCLK